MKRKGLLTEESILNLVDRFMSASIKKDSRFMHLYLHPDFLFATPRGTLFTYDSFFNNFLLNPSLTLLTFERVEQKVFLTPGLALMNGIVKARFKDAEEQYERISFLWVPSSTKWSLLQIHSTFTTRPVL